MAERPTTRRNFPSAGRGMASYSGKDSNPASSKVYIDTEFHEVALQLIDVNSKVVIENNRFTEREIDVSQLPKGIYLIKIMKDKQISSHKLIVR